MEYENSACRRIQFPSVTTALILLALLLISVCVAQLEFKWHFGAWSECQHSSCGPGGNKHRDVWCIFIRTGHRVMDDYCNLDFKPVSDSKCSKSCSEKVILKSYDDDEWETNTENHPPDYADYYPPGGLYPEDTRAQRPEVWSDHISSRTSDVEWVVDQWSSCKLAPGAKSCGRNSGIQHRNVTCEMKGRHSRVNSARCQTEEAMPATSQSCELLCKQNCVVSSYSDWSGCDSTCQVSNQTRTRHVIVPPRHRGSHCPGLSEMLECDNCTNSYTYKFSDWLPCTAIGGSYLIDNRARNLIGFQSREIMCLQSKGVMTSLRFCSDKLPQTVLQKHRSCILPQDCQVSPWSAMRPHNTSCIGYDGQIVHGFMVRTRQVTQLPLGDGKPCPAKLVDFIKLSKENSSLLRSCKRAKWIMSHWSLCQSVPGYNHCGTGMQSRRAICIEAGDDGVERPVDDARCPQPKPLVAQSCSVECGWDCSVSQWSMWSTCQDSDCDMHDVKKRDAETQLGKKFRTREILTLPGPRGSPCPHLSETKSCKAEACFTWNVTLGPCEATTRGGCGDGTQLKKALCLNRAGMKVRERFCHESLHSEQNWENCYVPCPEDCILSEWGQWSLCPDPCHVKTGVSSMRTRLRQILAYHGPGRNSRPCPPTNALRQSEPCPILYDCSTYQWETSAWGQCMLNIDNPNVHCGPGSQTRNVECYTSKGDKAADNKCMEKVKPKNIQPCVVECPVDCHVTEWSEWSDCGVKCLPVQARQIYPTQIRRRFILQYPRNGGLACPSDLREEQSCYGLPVCQTYYWKTSEWSDCVLPPVVPLCGQGLRARNITCYQADDQNTIKASTIVCLEKLGSKPDQTEVCHNPCESECQFTPWSQWTACGPWCEKTRFRFRRLRDDSKSNPECRNTELYPRDEHQDCICDSIQPSLIGGWSDCIIQSNDGEDRKFASMSLTSISARHRRTNETGVTGLDPNIYCGAGKQYMAFSCQNFQEKGGKSLCNGEEYQEENCTIPCPVDCQTTAWTTWNQCSTTCGAGVQQRERRIMTLPENGGRKCPFMFNQDKETQTRVCRVECSYNIWRTEDWGPCIPSGSKACGEGTHSRTVRCVSVGLDGTEMTVDEIYCGPDDEPQVVKSCSLPCPGDCVLSEWTEWSLCRQPCNGRQTQARTRNVLRMSGSYAFSQTCSNQREERVCEKWKNCVEYYWEHSDWTSCLVNGGGTECGVGHKERYAFCRNENGEVVEPYRCEKLFGPVTEPMVVSCEISCDNDCLMSDWSDWSTCSTTCGLGLTKRRRTVLQSPIGNGRKCPEKLDQSKPCFHAGCYRWLVSEWSRCIIPKGVCGSGIQERNVSCLNDEGKRVNSSRCPIDPEILILQTHRPCHVPCPGECKLSEWSSWSDCFISCEDFQQGYTVGVQARSRAILAYPVPGNTACNETLWEEQICEAQHCSWFKWITTSWDMVSRRRQVYCARNDGSKVTGGCDETHVPASELTCTDPGCLSPAVCEDVNVCSCPSDPAFIRHYVDPMTVTCVKNTTTTTDKASSGAEMSKSPKIWMYAVIAVGTLIVIAITAALYNMCELFRTGPRPRRKDGTSCEASVAGTIHSQEEGKDAVDSDNQRSENIYKQINHVDHVGRSVFGNAGMSSAFCSDCKYSMVPSVSCTPGDASDLDGTPLESSSVTTTTTPLTPVNQEDVCIQLEEVTGATRKNSVPALSHKKNRRYKRIHHFLPDRFVRCFTCGGRSSKRMLGEQRGKLRHCSSCESQEQTCTLTEVEPIELWENVANTSSGFQNHNCMLFRKHDHRPADLGVSKHDTVCDKFPVTKYRTSPADEVELRISRLSPHKTKISVNSSPPTAMADDISSPCISASSTSLKHSTDRVHRNIDNHQPSPYTSNKNKALQQQQNSSDSGYDKLQQQVSLVPKSIIETPLSLEQNQPWSKNSSASLKDVSPPSSHYSDNLTSFLSACDTFNQNSSDLELPRNNTSPLHTRFSPLLTNHTSPSSQNIYQHIIPKYNKPSGSKTPLSTSPLLYHNPRAPSHHHNGQNPTASPAEIHRMPTSTRSFDSSSNESTAPKHTSFFLSHPSHENLITNVQNSSNNYSEIGNPSMHPESSVIPQPPFNNPELSMKNLYSFQEENDCNMIPLHVETSVRSKHENPVPSNHKFSSGVSLHSPGTSATSSQVSPANSMETSV